MSIHNNYAKMEENNPEMKQHIDNMYDLVNNYAKENGISLAYDDRAERFVESLATYTVESERP
jgi:Skp family chaperone for outer membrane proteins